jgi:hypothetical protein
MPPAARAAPAGGFAVQIHTVLCIGVLDARPHFLASFKCRASKLAKARLNFSPHWPVDFCAPKRLVFGFAACGALGARFKRRLKTSSGDTMYFFA